SHLRGARSVPSVTGSSDLSGREAATPSPARLPALSSSPLDSPDGSFRSSVAGLSSTSASSPEFANGSRPSSSGATQRSDGEGASGGAPVLSASGTCRRDRYSATRLAEKSSALHRRRAMKARPAASGRLTPIAQ